MIIAGGGTGGHLYPGIAVAEELLKRNPRNRVLFVGTSRGIEHRVLPQLGYELQEIDVEGVKGRGVKALLKGIYTVPKSMLQSRAIIRNFMPHVVIGVGGYASGPTVLAARLLGIPTAIAEQNALAGNTNRILGKVVDRIFLTYEESRKGFSRRKVRVTGNPVRAAFIHQLTPSSREDGMRRVLVFGGSQGAAAINKAVMEMLPLAQARTKDICFVHQSGQRDVEAVRQSYARCGFIAEVLPFITEMASALASADLIVCRAGATSLAEITVAGKASVLIPFPYAIGDHQTKNAEAMVRSGAAVMIRERDLSAALLWRTIESLIGDIEKLVSMEAQSLALARPDAAAKIVDACLSLAHAGH